MLSLKPATATAPSPRDARERREDSERPDEATSRRALMAPGPETLLAPLPPGDCREKLEGAPRGAREDVAGSHRR